MMYLTGDDFSISVTDILIILVVISIGPSMLQMFGRKIRDITRRDSGPDDYPGSTKLPDVYKENNFDKDRISDIADAYYIERREKVIFEENISGVPFRYDEKTKVLTIGEMFDPNTPPISAKLNSLDDLRKFVDRLEKYIDE